MGGSLTEGAKVATLRHRQGFVAGDDDPLEGMVGFDFLFHLGLDLLEILGRDPVGEFDVVVEAVLDRRAGGELGVGPELRMAVARTWAAEWRNRSSSVICARCSKSFAIFRHTSERSFELRSE